MLLTEHYGKKEAYKSVWIGFLCLMLFETIYVGIAVKVFVAALSIPFIKRSLIFKPADMTFSQ